MPAADRDSLSRQRRFLILMSLAVLAFYALGADVKTEAQYSGFILTLNRPDRVALGLWGIWAWALWRYLQRMYELLSVVWNDLLDDVYAEDRRIALARARKEGNRQAENGEIEGLPRKARILGRVTVEPPSRAQLTDFSPDGELTTFFRDYFPMREGGRTYPTLKANFEYVNGTKWGISEERFVMKLSRRQSRWVRVQAWTHSLIRLPAFTDHIAPLLLATAAALFAIFVGHADSVAQSHFGAGNS